MFYRGVGKGGVKFWSPPPSVSSRGVPVMTETAIPAGTTETHKTATVASLPCVWLGKQKEGKVLSRTAEAVKTAKAVMKATLP